MYTFEPLPGVLCGGLVPRGSWGAGDGGRNFQEAMRRKRKHDAEIKEEMMRVMSSGVLRCEPRMDVDEGGDAARAGRSRQGLGATSRCRLRGLPPALPEVLSRESGSLRRERGESRRGCGVVEALEGVAGLPEAAEGGRGPVAPLRARRHREVLVGTPRRPPGRLFAGALHARGRRRPRRAETRLLAEVSAFPKPPRPTHGRDPGRRGRALQGLSRGEKHQSQLPHHRHRRRRSRGGPSQ